MTHSFQVDTDRLQAVIDHFDTLAAHSAALVTRLEDHLEALQAAGWHGAAAQGVLARLEHDILPRVVKLREGMGAAGAALAEFLERMEGIEVALDHLNTGMPKFNAAREKIQEHLEKLQNRDPDEMKVRLQQILRDQGHNDAADQLDHITF